MLLKRDEISPSSLFIALIPLVQVSCLRIPRGLHVVIFPLDVNRKGASASSGWLFLLDVNQKGATKMFGFWAHVAGSAGERWLRA